MTQVIGGETRLVEGEALGCSVFGKDISYEDIRLLFLYWDDAETLLEERFRSRD
jgi:hypothetical protein